MASPTVFIAGSFVYPDLPFIEMDATTEVSHNFTARVSEHPVEVGADITDHVRAENPTFDIKGYVSNHHIMDVQAGNVIGNDGKRTQIVYDYLRDMYNRSIPFTLVTEFESFTNCVITDLNIPVTADKAEAVEINLKVKKLRLVAVEYLNTSVTIAEDKSGDSEGTRNGGTESTEEAPEFFSRTIRAFETG